MDEGAASELSAALERPRGTWDVLISHFLGVDHAGHTHAVAHESMRERLRFADSVVDSTARALASGAHGRALLLVLGDHGQTMTGDHGGQDPEETDSVLVAAVLGGGGADSSSSARGAGVGGGPADSPVRGGGGLGRGGVRRQLHDQVKLLRAHADMDGNTSAGETANAPRSLIRCSQTAVRTWAEDCLRVMPQLDFAATLAMLMGARVPYSSLGSVDPELWALAAGHYRGASSSRETGSGESDPGGDGGEDDFSAEDSDGLACELARSYSLALEHNVVQVNEYVRAYGEATRRGVQSVGGCNGIDALYEAASTTADAARDQRELGSAGCEHALAHVRASRAYLTAVASLARARWTTFNVPLMAAGATLMALVAWAHARGLARALRGGIDALGLVLLAFECVAHASCLISNSLVVAEGEALRVLCVVGALSLLRRALRLRESVLATLGVLVCCSAMAASAFADDGAAARQLMRDADGQGEDELKGELVLTYLSAVVLGLCAAPVLVRAMGSLPKGTRKGGTHQDDWFHVVRLCFALTIITWGELDLNASGALASWLSAAGANDGTAAAVHAILRTALPRLALAAPLVVLAWAGVLRLAGVRGVGNASFGALIVGPLLLLLLGRTASAPMLFLLGALACLLWYARAACEGGAAPEASMILAVLLWQRACALFFFATGHRCVPSALQYGASFVGFDTFDFVRCGAALAGNTYAHAILGAAALPAFASAACGDSSSAVAATAADTTSISSGPHEDKHESCESARQSNRPDTYARMVARTGLAYTFAPSLNLAVTLAFTLAERRHLMMWALFAPKLMYDALALLVGAGAAAMACGAAVTLRSM